MTQHEGDGYPGVDWIGWSSWPTDRPRPTRDEWIAAKARWSASSDPNDFSDFNCDFSMAIATYSRWTWWKLFFPDDAAGFEEALQESLAAAKSLAGDLVKP